MADEKRFSFFDFGGPRPASVFLKYFEILLLAIMFLTPVKCHIMLLIILHLQRNVNVI
jgi:hypothetical protein